MRKVIANTKSVQELFTGVTYEIDFYQRGYLWKRRNIEELLNDLLAEFNANYLDEHEPAQIANYQHYFLGTIITITESGRKYIVDGQQRLTTLTLLLIHFHHLRKKNPSIPEVKQLIFPDIFLPTTFTIEVKEREDCMRALYENNHYDATDHPDLSVRHLVERYADIDELIPDSVTGNALLCFIYWLIKCVDLVEIEAPTDAHAFTVFETMNDRGVNLSQSDMLKGYLLAHINFADPNMMQAKKEEANRSWKRLMTGFADLENGNADDFFKTWLRAKYAAETRERRQGAVNQDFENIDKYHRWTRDNRARLGLNEKDSQAFYDFITERMRRFAGYYIRMKQAALRLTQGQEEVYYNAYNNFTLQYILALATLRYDDDVATVNDKIRVVTIFADIFLARRMVNFRRIGYSTLQYTMFNLAKDIRDKNLDDVRNVLRDYLDGIWETFEGITGHNWGIYSLNKFSGRSIRYLLARMTAWTEQQTGKSVNFQNFLWDTKGRSLEIEHIWANKFERHEDEYSHENDFQRERNFFGGLVLLPKGSNASFGADPYKDKLTHYIEENLLAASLHPQKYDKNSDFRKFREKTGLPFKPHTEFKRADLMERQELYRQICEQIWNPERLNAI